MKNRLKEVREQSKLTQKEVADKLEITESAYRRYESGNSNPSVQRAIAIAKILKTTVEELFT